MTPYDELVVQLICLLDGDILPLPRADDLDRNDERIAIAICETTGITREFWETLNRARQEPWLEKAIAILTKQRASPEAKSQELPAEQWSEAKPPAEWRKQLKISETTWRNHVKKGKLVVDKISDKLCRIRQDTLERYTGKK